ncbi:MAG: hypothetical protein NT129_01765 [Candidatus Aenigmarchaeota archaeon]|nr:hypothetical protein [Candidatus Aenigmarchaeota archaeon]
MPIKREEPFQYIKAKPKKDADLASREYKLFLEEEQFASLPRTLYEKACRSAEKLIKVSPDKKTGKILQEAIDFSHLKITPAGVASLTIIFAFLVCCSTLVSLLLKIFFHVPGLSLGHALVIMSVALPFTYYLYEYPLRLKRRYVMEAGSGVVTMIMYIAMFMRNVPNLEGAVRFASENLTGTLGFELRKLVWDVDVGNYLTVNEALTSYADKWKKNKNFIEAVEIIIESMQQTDERRIMMLDEAVDVILDGNRENAKHFNQSLRTPVTVIHAMGIILPVMGLILFPLVAIFLKVESSALLIGYDVLLPIALFFIINHVLEKRPSTFSKIEIADHPDMPPKGKFLWNKKPVSAWIPALIVGLVVITLGVIFLLAGLDERLAAIMVTGGIAYGLGIYFKLLSYQRMDLRTKIMEIENEFTEALFQFGNQVSGGVPIELSLEHNVRRIENLKIKDLFQKALNNMKTMGLTFEQAFFDREYGAIRYYPSRLISSVMRTVTESAKKGMKTASITMLSVSRYLKNIHKTQEEVKDTLSDTISSMRFQAIFLSPMIGGVVVTLALVVLKIMEQMSTTVKGMPIEVGFLSSISEASITPFQFIFIVAIYMIETCIILSIFVNGIENGEDPIGRNDTAANYLMVGFLIFAIVIFITLIIFEPMINIVMA